MVKRMSAKEFREQGFLRELNRNFLHPLGLALEVVVEEDGREFFDGVWDCRDDPEGIVFAEDSIAGDDAVAQADAIAALRDSKVSARQKLLGQRSTIQSLRPSREE